MDDPDQDNSDNELNPMVDDDRKLTPKTIKFVDKVQKDRKPFGLFDISGPQKIQEQSSA